MTSSISLDLMEFDGKATPEAVVGEIVRQNPQMPFPVPLDAIASAAGIERIEEMTTEGFEGMLMTNPEKSRGVILVKANGNPQRRRFTVGHELGHYLLPWHRQTEFSCTAQDIKETPTDGKSNRGFEMEVEANAFASELLMPSVPFRQFLRGLGEPTIEHVVQLSAQFDTSIEATARRFMNVCGHPVAFVFSQGNTIRYWTKGPEFPFLLRVRNGQQLPRGSYALQPGEGVGDMEELDAYTWLSDERRPPLPDTVLEQTLYQKDGYKVTMLLVEAISDEDDA